MKKAVENLATKPTKCGGCGSEKFSAEGKGWKCEGCGGLVAEHIYLGDSYGLVLPVWHTEAEGVDSLGSEFSRYYDFSGVGSEGPYRRHGWFHTETRKILQTG